MDWRVPVRLTHVRGRIQRYVLIGVGLTAVAGECAEVDDIEFVAEHLPEVAMDNRYATLPIWSVSSASHQHSSYQLQSAWSSATSGNLEIEGPMFSASVRGRMGPSWQAGAFAFYDPLQLRSGTEQRPLQTLFAPGTPIERPVAAEFSGLDGTVTDAGVGLYMAYERSGGWLGAQQWVVGALWQRVDLHDYRFDYRITAGPSMGATGQIDFDARYEHLVPLVGFELPRRYGLWSTSAHALLAWPIPRRGVVGHITGPGFDIHGDTEDVGEGRHFGDPSLTLGYSITYEPAHLSIDVGTLLTQALLEPQIHNGVDRTVLLSFSVAWSGSD